MVSYDIGPIVNQAVERAIAAHKGEFESILQQAREIAWAEGYQTCYEDKPRNNPYRKANPDATA
jgi:hypothetical protein